MSSRASIILGVGVIALVVASLGLVAAPGTAPGGDRLTIGAYSVIREALHEGILPAFRAHWERKTGRPVWFEESYNGSGAQARAIASGFDADVAILSMAPDLKRLVEAGLVRSDWDAGPRRGVVTQSLVVIGHRRGNPKGLRDWDDLARPGVGVLYPDPKTSGGARWNINAIFGAGLLRGRDRHQSGPPSAAELEAARDLLARIQANVVTMDASGRQSMATFLRGTGDAVVTYENELLLQRRLTGEAVPYVIPPATLVIEGPAALVEPSVERHGNRAVAEAFLTFLRSGEAQRILGRYGFRPLNHALEAAEAPGRKPLPPRLFTIADLGGWGALERLVYAPGGVWDSLFTRPLSSRKE